MIIKCINCGTQNKLPISGKAEDYKNKVFKCKKCKKLLFAKSNHTETNPWIKPVKNQKNHLLDYFKTWRKQNSMKEKIIDEYQKITTKILRGKVPDWKVVSIVLLLGGFGLLGAFTFFNKGSYDECVIKELKNTGNASEYIVRNVRNHCRDKYPRKKPISEFVPIPVPKG